MKYSDRQRVEKMRETAEKLLRYLETEYITPERVHALCQRSIERNKR